MRHRLLAFLFLICIFSCSRVQENEFVHVSDSHFVKGGETVSFIGTNFWYGPILASEGEGGDRERLKRELDTLKSLGINNLRVLVGGDGPDGIPTRIEPTLQKSPGAYDETLLEGLDYFLVELARRDMQAVLFLNNAWEWSGGFGMYLEWATGEPALIPAISGYGPFMKKMADFNTDFEAQDLFFNHIRNIVSRTNSITGVPYSEDPTIFSWQICNEPRPFSTDESVVEGFLSWIADAAELIHELDPNHMVSSGNEGAMGCNDGDYELTGRLNECPGIDYVTAHIWPYNWSWVSSESPQDGLETALRNTETYIDRHMDIARRVGKPLVIEEFGFPRDDFQFSKGTTTEGRDRYLDYIFDRVVESHRDGDVLAGANFWTWGGFAAQAPDHSDWRKGDDYSGDPAQEQQGLNSVYVSDSSTLDVIRRAAAELVSPAGGLKARLNAAALNGRYMYGHQDDLSYGHSWKVGAERTFERSDVLEVCGDYPAIVGFDLGGIELGGGMNLDDVPFDVISAAAVAHTLRGGIVTFSWHPRNPLTGGDSWDVSSDKVVASVLPGGECHDEFMQWLSRAADFFETMRLPDGRLIPMIFRPWHENVGSWFWWGGNLCSEEEYKALFIMTHDFFVKERGMTDIVWAYSPNSGISEEQYMSRYPGDEYVDVLGIDHYEYLGSSEEQALEDRIAAANRDYIDVLRNNLGFLAEIASEKGKIMALSETGLESLVYDGWWTEVLMKGIDGFPVSYVLTWRNACTMSTHFFAPFPGFDGAEDFILFHDSDKSLFLRDIQ